MDGSRTVRAEWHAQQNQSTWTSGAHLCGRHAHMQGAPFPGRNQESRFAGQRESPRSVTQRIERVRGMSRCRVVWGEEGAGRGRRGEGKKGRAVRICTDRPEVAWCKAGASHKNV